jgi:hypothetical protein
LLAANDCTSCCCFVAVVGAIIPFSCTGTYLRVHALDMNNYG